MTHISLKVVATLQSKLPTYIPIQAAIGKLLQDAEKKGVAKVSDISDVNLTKLVTFLKKTNTITYSKYIGEFDKYIKDMEDKYTLDSKFYEDKEVTKSLDKGFADIEEFNRMFVGRLFISPGSFKKYFDQILDDEENSGIEYDITYTSGEVLPAVLYSTEYVAKVANQFNEAFTYNNVLINQRFMRNAFNYLSMCKEELTMDVLLGLDLATIAALGYAYVYTASFVSKFVSDNLDKCETNFF
jgi:hypothetical protein